MEGADKEVFGLSINVVHVRVKTSNGRRYIVPNIQVLSEMSRIGVDVFLGR